MFIKIGQLCCVPELASPEKSDP